MQKIKEIFLKYKWILLSGVVIGVIACLITANLQLINFMSCKIKGDEAGIIKLLSAGLTDTSKQDNWFYVSGIKFLTNKEHFNEESRTFFETNFESFILERQKEIVKGYNTNKALFGDSVPVVALAMDYLEEQDFGDYIKRVDAADIDAGLSEYYGKTVQANEALVNKLYDLTNIYLGELPFDKFQFSLYELMELQSDDEQLESKINTVCSRLNSEKARDTFFEEVKMQTVDGDDLYGWIEFLNRNQIIDNTEYMSFSTLYSGVHAVRNQYKQIESEEIDLNNKKEAVEVQIKDKEEELKTAQQSLADNEQSISSIDAELDQLTNYASTVIYVEKNLGDDEYQASPPKKSLFGNYKASSQKYIVKLNSTEVYNEGVYYVDLALSGTKLGADGKEYPYYVEISNDELNRIAILEDKRQSIESNSSELKSQISSLQLEIDNVKQSSGYEAIVNELSTVTARRDGLTKQLEEIAVKLQTMFSIKKVNIKISTEEASDLQQDTLSEQETLDNQKAQENETDIS